jgi:hypothetical protein
MKPWLALLLSSILFQFSFAGEHHQDDDDFIGWDGWFHNNAFHRTEDFPELYLVCIHGIKVQPHGIMAGEGWEELGLRSTIVDVVRGDKKVGDQLDYRRYLDGKAVNPEKRLGTLWYVFVTETDDGKHRFVDPQDPVCHVPYTEKLAKIVAEHRAYRKPTAAGKTKPEEPGDPAPLSPAK